ncbi:MAG: hypothetical protein ACOYMM_08590 [Phycisphaerales bacterium]
MTRSAPSVRHPRSGPVARALGGPLGLAAWVVTIVIALAALALPAAALLTAGLARGETDATATGLRDAREITGHAPLATLALSVALAFAAATVGAALAWPASRAFRRNPWALGNQLVVCAVLLPIVLPPWLLYAALWMSTGPGTWVGDLCARGDLVGVQRAVLLGLSLVVWSSSAAFAALASAGPAEIVTDGRLLALDGAGLARRGRAALARDGRSLLIAILATAAFLLCETTVFDLALVPTYGFEIKTLDALGATPGEVLRAAWPALATVIALVAAVPLLARVLGDRGLRARAEHARGGGRFHEPRGVTRARPAVALVGAAVLPLAVLTALAAEVVAVPRASDFMRLHGAALVATVTMGLCAATLVAALAAGMRCLIAVESPAARMLARTTAFGALACGLAPATLAALAIEAAYNNAALGSIYDSPAAVVLALALRAAPAAAIVVLALEAREARSARRLRALDGTTLTASWRGMRAELGLSALAAGAVAFAWSLGELTASGRVVTPGLPWLATDVLNAVHFQRPDTVFLAAGALVVAAIPALLALLVLLRHLQGSGFARAILSRGAGSAGLLPVLSAGLSAGLLTGVLALLPGCGRAESTTAGAEADDPVMSALRQASPTVSQLLPVDRELAGVGRAPGQFNGPRVVACDASAGADACVTFVIDKDARVQRFLPSGEVASEWRLPKTDRGKPVGATVAPDGNLVVADTHEHRIVCFSPTGELRWTLGGYGTGAGEFIYPTDVVFTPDGRMLVAEYGGNDRIQAFGTDRAFMYQFGRCGTGEGEFLRPQCLAYDAARDELYVCDSSNHRIQVFTSDGEFRRSVGRPGLGAGELSYPFGLVLEIGGRAVDRLGRAMVGPDAASAAPTGTDAGAHTDPDTDAPRTLVVVEHSNHRLQRLDATDGRSLWIAGGIGRERGRLKYPWAIEPAGVSADGRQRYAVCDHGNSRIVFFALPRGQDD